MSLMWIYGELGWIARLPKRPVFLINSDPPVVLCFKTSSFLWQNQISCMMKRQCLVVTTWGLSGDCEPTFGVDGLLPVRIVFFLSTSLVGVVLFPSYAH